MKKNFVLELKNRKILHDSTPGIEELMEKEIIRGYIGVDPTSDSLHIGNLASLMMLTRLQDCGHEPIAVVGGATGMVGDPSGKSAERNLLQMDELIHNQEGISKQIQNLLQPTKDYQLKPLVLNNYTWYEHFRLLDFLRDVGKNLTVNYMTAKDSVQKRLETGLSFTEFSYQLLQAYDFYYLYQNFNCKLQMGGSDQWGNITSGTEMVRRMCQGSAFGITTPLLTKADGTKFGKSETGNIWLDPQKTSPYKFYQYFVNAADSDIEKLVMVFSLKELSETEVLLTQHQSQPELRLGQKSLAEELTIRIHGQSAYDRALEVSTLLFGNSTIDGLQQLTASEFLDVFEGVPTTQLPYSAIEEGINIVDLLVQMKASPSKTEARKSVQGGAVKINKQKVDLIETQIKKEFLLNNKYLLVQVGKKSYYIGIIE